MSRRKTLRNVRLEYEKGCPCGWYYLICNQGVAGSNPAPGTSLFNGLIGFLGAYALFNVPWANDGANALRVAGERSAGFRLGPTISTPTRGHL